MRQNFKTVRPVVVASLLALTLISAPASASHNSHDYVAPLAAFIAFSWLTNRSSPHNYRYNRNYNQRHYYQERKRRHSYSYGSSQKRRSYSH